jgi:hypothetical protein
VRVVFFCLFVIINDCGLEFLNCSCLVEKIVGSMKDWFTQILRFYPLFVLFYGCLDAFHACIFYPKPYRLV